MNTAQESDDLDDLDAQYRFGDRVDAEMEMASIETGLRLSTVLDPDSRSEIMEALDLDQDQMAEIHLRLCNAKAYKDFGLLFASPANAAFYNLKIIARKLAELARQLMLSDSQTLDTILQIAFCCSGNIKEHAEVRNIMATLNRYNFDPPRRSPSESTDQGPCICPQFFDPSKFFHACSERYEKSPDKNFVLAVVETLQEGIDKALALAPETPRGSPGNSYRKSIICELAVGWEEVVGEAPTCSPNGRFMLLCDMVLAAMGLETDGLDKAVQRILRQLKQS